MGCRNYMKSYYWYLVLDKNSKFVTVDKIKGFLFIDYKFINGVSPKMKKIIKRKLYSCPVNYRYTFAYIENDNTFYVVTCVGVMCIDVSNETEYWKSICGESFFSFCCEHGLTYPEHHLGNFVFNTFGDNIERGNLIKEGQLYKVKDTDDYVYPLKAFE